MNERVEAHLRKAQERLKDAEGMLSLARYAGAVNRTYYAMFEAASAMLASLGLVCESHQGVINKFGELFAKTGRVEPRLGHNLKEAFGLREDADYALDARGEIPRHTAEAELRKALEFVTMAEEFLKRTGREAEGN